MKDLGTQLSAERRSHVVCWGLNKTGSGRINLTNPANPANATAASTPDNVAKTSLTGGDVTADESEGVHDCEARAWFA